MKARVKKRLTISVLGKSFYRKYMANDNLCMMDALFHEADNAGDMMLVSRLSLTRSW